MQRIVAPVSSLTCFSHFPSPHQRGQEESAFALQPILELQVGVGVVSVRGLEVAARWSSSA